MANIKLNRAATDALCNRMNGMRSDLEPLREQLGYIRGLAYNETKTENSLELVRTLKKAAQSVDDLYRALDNMYFTFVAEPDMQSEKKEASHG
jgi:hypothetical protein